MSAAVHLVVAKRRMYQTSGTPGPVSQLLQEVAERGYRSGVVERVLFRRRVAADRQPGIVQASAGSCQVRPSSTQA